MSPNPNGDGDPGPNRPYGFSGAQSQPEDRHIQNIINHTNSMFNIPTPRVPQFAQGTWPDDRNSAAASYFVNPYARDDMMSDQHLDDLLIHSRLSPVPRLGPYLDEMDRVVSPLYSPGFNSRRHLSTEAPPPPEPHEYSSSSSELGKSSPSTRLSIRRQEPATSSRPRPSDISLDLDHAPSQITPKIGDTYLLDPRRVLPDKCRTLFPYQLFNAVQSKSFPLAYGSNDNIVISAPTGSGKTAVLEMAICKLVMTSGDGDFKIVYLAPTKSLCSERASDWEKKFSHLSLHCAELTGDTSQAQTRRVGEASVIVTTPEKWDSITRKWSDHHKLLSMVKLVLIDEIHILNNTRGATLEAVVSRMKTSGADVRFVGLSATVPNIEDIATWLGKNPSNQSEPATYEYFDETLRPVKLKKYVYGYDSPGNDFIFDKMLDTKLIMLLGKHTEKKPIMVFCFTRKACEKTANKLAEWWTTCAAQDKPWPNPQNRIPVISKDLQEIVRYGVAFHHAGLYADERAAIEQSFLSGQLHVICCTSTLAVGVNLPCHTVVLKGTVAYNDGILQELSDLDVLQMLGRAGRPQFDRTATAIVLTRRDKVERYERMVSGMETLESKLHLNLIEHLNSEVGLGTIQTLDTAKKWIDGTFLHVRMRQNPDKYIVEGDETGVNADESLQQWCERDIRILQQYDLITKGDSFMCTEYGKAMSKYMVKFETMKLLLAIPKASTMEQLLSSLSKAAEFKDFRFKPLERAVFRKLNKDVAYPIQTTVNEPWHYVLISIQMHLGHIELPNDKESGFLKRQMAAEKVMIFDRLNRLVRCMIDCRVFDGDAVGARVGLEVVRSISACTWENHPAQIQQIPGIGSVAMRKFQAHDVRTVLELAKLSSDHIERIMSRNPPFGKNLSKALEGFPQLTMRTEVLGAPGTYKKLESSIGVEMRVVLGHNNQKHPPSWAGKIPAVTFMAETSDGKVSYFTRSNIKNINGSDGLELRFPVALSRPDEVVSFHFSCEEIVGTEVKQDVQVRVNAPASAFAARDAQVSPHPVPVVQIADSQDEYLSKNSTNEIADEDMLEALDEIIGPSHSSMYDLRDTDNDEYPEIDELTGDQSPTTAAPTQMKNGRWMCNHPCRGGGLTKNGKLCTHKCCKEGLEKPRPPPKRKSVAEESQAPPSTAGRKKAKIQPITESGPKQKKKEKDGSTRDHMVELIDLSGLPDDNDDFQLSYPSPNKAKSRKNKLPDLHEKIQGQQTKPHRITKPMAKSTSSPKPAAFDRGAAHPFELAYELDDSDALEDEEGEDLGDNEVFKGPRDAAIENPSSGEPQVPSSSPGKVGEDGGSDQPFFLDPNPFEVAVNTDAGSSQSKAPEWASEISPEVMDLIKGIVEVDGWKP
ncbi:hypothetical protein PG999_005644 [Apiospora kogelbergensis]|uniref:DNA 3'-5' helicase n=1 Tax=Apiospora kogelbergensis TaxID=1337665 RepID=A0AAW0R2V1_9PEZI